MELTYISAIVYINHYIGSVGSCMAKMHHKYCLEYSDRYLQGEV